MARINIEGSIYKDDGFQNLTIAIGRLKPGLDASDIRRVSKGILVELYELAQSYWFPHQKPIPLEVFKEKEFPEALHGKDGLCIKKSDGIYVRGSKDLFAWLFQKSTAGKASGESRREAAAAKKQVSAQDNSPEKPNERPLTHVERTSTELNLLTPSSLLFSPNSELTSHNSIKSSGGKKPAGPKPQPLGSVAFEEYAKAYEARHHVDIRKVRDQTINSMFKKFGKKLGADAPLVAAFYLTHNDFVYVKSKHCIELLVRDAHKLWAEWKSGNKTTTITAKSAELDDHNRQVGENYLRSKQAKERSV